MVVACCFRSPRTKGGDDEAESGKPRRGRRRGHRQAERDRAAPRAPTANGVTAGAEPAQAGLPPAVSLARSELGEDFVSCRDDFSVTEGSVVGDFHSLPASPRQTLGGVASSGHHSHTHTNGGAEEVFCEMPGASESESEAGSEGSSNRPFAGCLHILDNITAIGSGRHGQAPGHGGAGAESPPRAPLTQRSVKAGGVGGKPPAGFSLQERDMSASTAGLTFAWEDAQHSVFRIRSQDYMKTKVKINSESALYSLACADIFATPKKADHIARLVTLPACGPPVMAGDVALPPLLIFNLQLPLYPAGIFGPYDGDGVSIVFYFRLPVGFDPSALANQKALALFKRFLTNGREADGAPTRDRLKLIPRVVNVEEWVQKGPLSQAEHKLLTTYNDKPILSRPQHSFYQGRSYFEVDLDLHQYTYLARRAITTYLTRLPHVVWENAFVVQGNAVDELPEQLMGVGRIYRTDFTKAKPLPAYSARPSDGMLGAGDCDESPDGASLITATATATPTATGSSATTTPTSGAPNTG